MKQTELIQNLLTQNVRATEQGKAMHRSRSDLNLAMVRPTTVQVIVVSDW
jgi:hypothetical protein